MAATLDDPHLLHNLVGSTTELISTVRTNKDIFLYRTSRVAVGAPWRERRKWAAEGGTADISAGNPKSNATLSKSS